jgi:hypothetical protein
LLDSAGFFAASAGFVAFGSSAPRNEAVIGPTASAAASANEPRPAPLNTPAGVVRSMKPPKL